MKILYALQCTGNGHIARAQELIPELKKYAEVDLLTSGHQSQIELPQEPKFRFDGISLLYDAKGGLSYWKTAFQNNFFRAKKDIKKVPLEEYDLVINDFEPISAWAAKLRNYPNILGISHQASMLFPETPKPERKDFLGEMVLKHYAPTKENFGFHFESYHPRIFKPIVRQAVRNLKPQNEGFYMTYLPSFSDEYLIERLNETHVDWRVFSKSAKEIYVKGNVLVYPIDQTEFLRSLGKSEGVLCNAGFELPAEALFLNKKLFVIPIKKQYEQECNATALQNLGVDSCSELNLRKIQEWVDAEHYVKVDYPDQLVAIIKRILDFVNSSEREIIEEIRQYNPVRA